MDPLKKAKNQVVSNLEILLTTVDDCVNEGMVDEGSFLYNQLLDWIDEVKLSDDWNELNEVIARAKTIEADLDAWASGHGRTSISLNWDRESF